MDGPDAASLSFLFFPEKSQEARAGQLVVGLCEEGKVTWRGDLILLSLISFKRFDRNKERCVIPQVFHQLSRG